MLDHHGHDAEDKAGVAEPDGDERRTLILLTKGKSLCPDPWPGLITSGEKREGLS